MNSKISVSIETNNLSAATKEEMWELYRHYYFYDKTYFMKRIESNTHFSFYKSQERIVGFTGLRINRSMVKGRKQFAIYFGQTVIHEECRGKSLIPMTGAKLCLKYWKELLFSDAYFWADALTYKAYLVFAKTLDEIYPSRRQQTPAMVKAVVDHLGQIHYQKAYCPKTGTVRKKKVLVNDTTMHIPQKYRNDDDIRFYVETNPKYIEGHGLLTITPMNASNLKKLMTRYIGKMIGINAGVLINKLPIFQKTFSARFASV